MSWPPTAATKIFTDKVTGKLAARPELDKALACLREGDVFVITLWVPTTLSQPLTWSLSVGRGRSS